MLVLVGVGVEGESFGDESEGGGSCIGVGGWGYGGVAMFTVVVGSVLW